MVIAISTLVLTGMCVFTYSALVLASREDDFLENMIRGEENDRV